MLTPVGFNTPVAMKFSGKKREPQFAGMTERQENAGMLALAGVAAGVGVWKLLQQARNRNAVPAADRPPTQTTPRVSIVHRPDGSLVLNEGRGDFFLSDLDDYETGTILTNRQGERIVFIRKTTEDGQLTIEFERL